MVRRCTEFSLCSAPVPPPAEPLVHATSKPAGHGGDGGDGDGPPLAQGNRAPAVQGTSERSAGPGRPRDAAIDAAILTAAQRHLARTGYDAMSLSAVAADANTTRQALYRRFPTKAHLATAAVAALSPTRDRPDSPDPFADLVAELEDFAAAMQSANGLAMAGTMLQGTAEPELVELYRDRLVRPRSERYRAILERARRNGHLDHDADIGLAVSLLTGSWYALALAGVSPPPDWAERVSGLAWQSLGGPRRGIELTANAQEQYTVVS